MTPKVLLVGKGPPDPGGIASYLQELAGAGSAVGHDLEFLNLARSEVRRAGRLTPSNLTRTLSDAWALGRAARQADIVHIHTALTPGVTLARAGLLAWTAGLSRKPVIVHVHSGLVELWLVTHPRRLFARAGLAPAARVLTASAASCTPLRNAVGSKALLIDNGVNVSSFSPGVPRHHRPTVLYAGLLTPRKGVIDLLEASTLLAESGVEHQLLLAGGTPDEGPEAEEQVRRAAEGRATLIGAVAHEAMAELYGRVDVFCLPSWWEAMPLSVLEAMAAGLPVVATRVGDTPRAVTDGVTGRLVSRKDPRALAEALRPLLLDADLRTRMGAAGREAVEARFDVSTMYSKLGAIYTQVISQHGKHKHGPFMSGRPGPGTGPV